MSLNVAWWAALLTRMSRPPRSSTAFLMTSRAAMLRVLQIAGHQHRLASCLFHELLDLVCLDGFVKEGDEDVRAFAGVRDRDGPAYSAVIPQ